MTLQLKIVVLVLSGSLLAILTRRSIGSLRAHGLYRLLAWITLIALVLLNIEVWFSDPWSMHQVISWVLLLLSVAAVTWGAISLKLGQSGDRRVDRTLIGFEGTTQLIEFGAYRYVRHPMYSSFLLGGLGVLLKDVSWPGILLTSVVFLCAILAARMEEQENIRFFGHAYTSYMKRTKMFFPFFVLIGH